MWKAAMGLINSYPLSSTQFLFNCLTTESNIYRRTKKAHIFAVVSSVAQLRDAEMKLLNKNLA